MEPSGELITAERFICYIADFKRYINEHGLLTAKIEEARQFVVREQAETFFIRWYVKVPVEVRKVKVTIEVV